MAVSQFSKFLEINNLDFEISSTTESTHTAQEAAAVHEVPVSNIVKSLLTKDQVNERYYLFLVPGDQRLDLGTYSNTLDCSLRMAEAQEVKTVTGYSIGGVPPFGHQQPLNTHILDGFDASTALVAAAGSSNAVFHISYTELVQVISDLKKLRYYA